MHIVSPDTGQTADAPPRAAPAAVFKTAGRPATRLIAQGSAESGIAPVTTGIFIR